MSLDPWSLVGEKLTRATGIGELMEDLGRALTSEPHMRMLGGGNPALIPEFIQAARRRLLDLAEDPHAVAALLGNYDPPQGHPRFLEAFAAWLNCTYGWPIYSENVAVTPGSQCATFFLVNLLAGEGRGGRFRKILLPLCPEYLGYADQGLTPHSFVACRPHIEWPEGGSARVFKYRVDFPAVESHLKEGDIAAMLVSRPTNPSANVLSDEEVRRLSDLALDYNIPLIIDQAYGLPFPALVYSPVQPYWAPHVILLFSLSKLGLPGTRTGIVVGPAPVVSAIASMTAVVGLANSSLGQQLVLPWIEDGSIAEIGPRWLRPFYDERRCKTKEYLRYTFENKGVPYALHADEGAFFHWLWLPDLRISSREFCQRLKQRKVLTVPGEYFFYGLAEEWPHRHQCLRLNYAGLENVVQEAIDILVEEAALCQR